MQKASKEELFSLRNKLLTEQVQKQTYQYILDTPIAAGTKPPNESELRGRLGVGRSATREAMRLLISRGILEVRRGSGTYVISTTSMDIGPLDLGTVEDKMALALDLVDVRVILEPGITEMATLNATEGDVERLGNLCDSVERRIKIGDSYIEDSIAFHTCMAEYSRNRVVEQLVPIINMVALMPVNIIHRKLTNEIITAHRAVTDTIAEHDPIGAKTTTMMHMIFNRNMIRQLMGDGRETQDWVYWQYQQTATSIS